MEQRVEDMVNGEYAEIIPEEGGERLQPVGAAKGAWSADGHDRRIVEIRECGGEPCVRDDNVAVEKYNDVGGCRSCARVARVAGSLFWFVNDAHIGIVFLHECDGTVGTVVVGERYGGRLRRRLRAGRNIERFNRRECLYDCFFFVVGGNDNACRWWCHRACLCVCLSLYRVCLEYVRTLVGGIRAAFDFDFFLFENVEAFDDVRVAVLINDALDAGDGDHA